MQRHYFANKGPSSQSYGFSSSHVWMWELDYKKSWVLKNWCFWTVVLEKTLESPLDCKEIQPVHPKGDQSWIFIGRTDAEAETPILWPPDEKNWLIWRDPDAGEDWGWEEKGTTEDEMVGWYHWLDGHEFEQTLGVGDWQGGLECCSPWGRKESDTTEWLNWADSCASLNHPQHTAVRDFDPDDLVSPSPLPTEVTVLYLHFIDKPGLTAIRDLQDGTQRVVSGSFLTQSAAALTLFYRHRQGWRF